MPLSGRNLLVIAHPDDETFFFGGTMLAGAGPRTDLICVTDGNFAKNGPERTKKLGEAARRLGLKSWTQWMCVDAPLLHLPVDDLVERLREVHAEQSYDAVLTHSPHGEYGHFNHMDTSLAVHRAFDGRAKVWSIADRLFPGLRITLERDIWEQKVSILEDLYFDEMVEAHRDVVVSASEGFVSIELAEVEAIHRLCTEGEAPSQSALRIYTHLAPVLEARQRMLR